MVDALSFVSRTHARTVLVTGASGGIGRAICLAFAREGWWVGVHCHQRRDAADETVRRVREAGGDGACYGADIRSSREAQALIDDVVRARERIDVMICNAGTGGGHLLLRHPGAEWHRIIETNLTGTFHCMVAAARAMSTHEGGSIMLIGSYAAFQGAEGQAAYAASKAGLLGLLATAALEWGPHNIRVNLACPGRQSTGLVDHRPPTAEQLRAHLLGRPADPTATAATICRLAQVPDASGQVWNLDSRPLP